MAQWSLSERNLEQHNKTCPTTDEAFGQSAIQQERARLHAECMYQKGCDSLERSPDGATLASEEIETQPPQSTNGMKLYEGPESSSETPWGRFMFASPVIDAQPWMAREMMNNSGIGCGDLESLEMRRLAKDFIVADDREDKTDGSLRSSSPTLSLSEINQALRGSRGKERPRVLKSSRMRRVGARKAAQG